MHYFVDVTIDNVHKQLSLNIPKSVGRDGISAHFLKKHQRLLPPLTHIINLSLKSRVVSRDFKTARV